MFRLVATMLVGLFLPSCQAQVMSATPDGDALDRLPVHEFVTDAPDYNRDAFGERWSDNVPVEFGHNGCDTRNDILARDLTDISYKVNTRDCVVYSGVLSDVYTGQTVTFQRGQDTSDLVQIDHLVPLANAWYAGAYQWDDDRRRAFANDPLNLQATTKAANQEKKAKTADKWLPSNTGYHCTFATRIVEVKTRYSLGVSNAERAALRKALDSCVSETPGA